MATLALVAIAADTLPAGATLASLSGWWMAGAMATMYADSRFILPALFPPPDAQGPTLGDLRASFGREGDPIYALLGPEVRVPGTIIWIGPIQKVLNDQGGGCGGGNVGLGPAYRFLASVAVAVGAPPWGTEIVDVTRIYANSRLIYDSHPEFTVTSSLLSTRSYTQSHQTLDVIDASFHTPIIVNVLGVFFPFNTGDTVIITGVEGNTAANGTWTITNLTGDSGSRFSLDGSVGNGYYVPGTGVATTVDVLQEIHSEASGPDLSGARAGYDLTVSGFSNSANNGTGKVRFVSFDTVRIDRQGVVTEAAGLDVTLDETWPAFNPGLLSSVRLHTGLPSQAPDPVMEATLGVGNVPAWGGLAYMVLENFDLTAFGNAAPSFSFLVEAQSSMTDGQAVAFLCDRAMMDPDEYDVSALTDTLRGYVVRGPLPSAQAIQPLTAVYAFASAQVGRKLVFTPMSALPTTVLSSDDLAAHSPGEDTARRSQVTEQSPRALPIEVQVRYVSKQKNYDVSMESYRRQGGMGVSGDQVSVIDTAITLTPQNAQAIARRTLWTAWSNFEQLEIRLPPSRVQVREGQYVMYTDLNRDWKMLVSKVDVPHDGAIVVSGVSVEDSLLDFPDSPADGGTNGDPNHDIPQPLELEVVDVAPFDDAQDSTAGVYWAVCRSSIDSGFSGGTLVESVDGNTYYSITQVPLEAQVGRAGAALGGGVHPYMVDRKNTVDVYVPIGDLATVSQLDFYNLSNLAVVGGEVIAWQVALLVAPNTWRLGVLLRGLRDTERWIDYHTDNERFVVMGSNGIRFLENNASDTGSTRYLKAVPNGGLEGDYDPTVITLGSNTVRPFSPTTVTGRRLTGGDVQLDWQRQSRAVCRMFSTGQIPLIDAQEWYSLEILSDDRSTVLRTVGTGPANYLTSPAYTYTKSMQDTDFGSQHVNINVNVYQVNNLVGRGRARFATVAPELA